jgi:hypothetical protein
LALFFLTVSFKYFAHEIFLGGKMNLTKCDSKGRVYLKEEIRAKYGREFLILQTLKEIILLPVPENPIKDLEELGKMIPIKSLQEIKKKIRSRGMQDVVR